MENLKIPQFDHVCLFVTDTTRTNILRVSANYIRDTALEKKNFWAPRIEKLFFFRTCFYTHCMPLTPHKI